MPAIGVTGIRYTLVGKLDRIESDDQAHNIVEHMKTVGDECEGADSIANDEFDEKEDNVYDKEEDYSGGAGHRHG